MTDFEKWWEDGGTCPHGMDMDEFHKLECRCAWTSSALEERERAALKVERMGIEGCGTLAIAAAIRKGDQDAPI